MTGGRMKRSKVTKILPIVLVLKEKRIAALDEWIARQPIKMGRGKAIRKLLKHALTAK